MFAALNNSNQQPTMETTPQIEKVAGKIAKAAKQANVSAPISYKENVLLSNSEYKKELATLGHCVRSLLQAADVKIHPKMLAVLKDIKNDKNGAYKIALNEVRKTKAGKYTVFALFQYLYKVAKQ
jgi:hypothetical protein